MVVDSAAGQIEARPAKDGKWPAYQHYPGDFERDMAGNSLAAQGLWIRMLGWMHENEAHRGFLELPSGEAMTEKQISLRIGRSLREVKPILAELKSFGVFSIAPSGALYCRRMARESHVSEVRRAAAKSRADKASRAADGTFAGDVAGIGDGEFAPAKVPATGEQNTVPSSSSSSSSSKADIDYAPTNHQNRDSSMRSASIAPSPIRQYAGLREALHRYFCEPGQEDLYPTDRLVADVMDAAAGETEADVIACLEYLYGVRGLKPGIKNGPRHWSWFKTVVQDYFTRKREREENANPCGHAAWAGRNEARSDRETFDRMVEAIELPDAEEA
jgi:hypothetical protein